jgi:hypothetical protein
MKNYFYEKIFYEIIFYEIINKLSLFLFIFFP